MAPEHVDDIRRRMSEIRQVLANDASHLAVSARRQADWRYYVTRHPWLCAGAAAVFGYLLVPAGAKKILIDAAALASMGRRGAPIELQRERSGKGLIAGTVLPILVRIASAKGLAIVKELAARHFTAKKPDEEQSQRSFSFRSR